MSKSKNTKKSKNTPYKIFISEFSNTHVGGIALDTDPFYVRVANKLYDRIEAFFGTENFSHEDIKRMALALACYLEDIVSGCGVWGAFISLFQKKYKRKFPFFDINDQVFPYDDELPSLAAVKFLLWYTANDANPVTMLNPENPGLNIVAMAIMVELLKAYDEAPETEARPIILPEEEFGVPVFFQVRYMCEWLLNRCYLTRVLNLKDTTEELDGFLEGLFRKAGISETESMKKYGIEAFATMNTRIGPLAIPPYEWLAEIVNLYHEPEEEEYIPILKEMKSRSYSVYKYDEVNEMEAILRGLDGKKYTLSAESMPASMFPPEVKKGTAALLSLVYFDGVWLMNGQGIQGMPGEVYDMNRKEYLKKKKEQRETYKYLWEKFGKKRIGACATAEEYEKIALPDGLPEGKERPEVPEEIHEADNLVYFLNSDSSVSMLPDFAGVIKFEGNPYYGKEESVMGNGASLILDHDYATPELREYLIKHKMLPDAALNSAISPEAGKKLFQRNMAFLNDYQDRNIIPRIMDC